MKTECNKHTWNVRTFPNVSGRSKELYTTFGMDALRGSDAMYGTLQASECFYSVYCAHCGEEGRARFVFADFQGGIEGGG